MHAYMIKAIHIQKYTMETLLKLRKDSQFSS